MKLTLCDILSAFDRKTPGGPKPCAPPELKIAVMKARFAGFLDRRGTGFVLSDKGAEAISANCKRRRK